MLQEYEICKPVVYLHSFLERNNFKVDCFRKLKCGSSSVGRARPCQGRGREFESRLPLIVAQVVELVDTQDLKSCGQ